MPSLKACIHNSWYHIVALCQEGSHVRDIDIAAIMIINVVFTPPIGVSCQGASKRIGHQTYLILTNVHLTVLLLCGGFIRVKAPVTWRPPHRSGREDFPHPVPQNTQALCLCITRQISLRLAHNSAAQLVISDAVSASEAMGTSYS